MYTKAEIKEQLKAMNAPKNSVVTAVKGKELLFDNEPLDKALYM